MNAIDQISYSSILNQYFTDLFNNTKSHYCDMLIVDVEQLSVFRPSIHTLNIDIYALLNIDREYENSLYDKIDSIIMEQIINYCASVNVIGIQAIHALLLDIASDLNRLCKIIAYYEYEPNTKIDMGLISYFSAFKSAIASVVTYQTKSFECISAADIEADNLPARFYAYNDSRVFFTEKTSVVTLTIRFYRKV